MNRIEERYINLNVIVKLEDFVEEGQDDILQDVLNDIGYCRSDCGRATVTKVEVDTEKGLERR